MGLHQKDGALVGADVNVVSAQLLYDVGFVCQEGSSFVLQSDEGNTRPKEKLEAPGTGAER